jgi:hypothetical protein
MMIVLEDLPEPPTQVFMLATPAHMLTKLHWEIYSLRKALSETPEHLGYVHAPSYCAYNCAVTAWHLADWTWKASTPEQRAYILSCLGLESNGQNQKDFVKFQSALRDRSRALHICRQLATGSKHMTVTAYPDPNVRAEMRWKSEHAQVETMRADDPLEIFRCQLVISDNGVERTALEVFEEAYKDWQRFLGAWGFVEGTPVFGRSPLA